MSAVKAVVGGFGAGFFSLLGAFNLVRQNKSLLKYVIIPLIINIVVFTAAVWWGFDLFEHFVNQYLVGHDTWYWQAVAFVVQIVAALVTMVAIFFAFTVVGNLIAAPFNDILSERTEQLLRGQVDDEPFSLALFFKDLARTMKDEVIKMAVFVGLMAVLLLMNLLPGVGAPLYAVCSVVLTVYFLIVEYTGYVFSRKHLGFAEQRRYISDHFLTSVGFGLAVMCTLTIPFVQFFTIPLAVIAATRICCSDDSIEQMVMARRR